MCGYVARSGSPIPRLITSMPALRFSATRRPNSANMYAGTASRRREGCVSAGLDTSEGLMGAKAYAPGGPGCSGILQRAHELGRELAGEHRLGGPREPYVEVVVHLDGQLTTIEPDCHGAGGTHEKRRDGRAARASPRGEGLPHSPLEDSRPDRRAVHADERDVGAVREELGALDLRPDRRQVEGLDLVSRIDHALWIADRDMPEGPLPASRCQRARAVRPARWKVVRRQGRPPQCQRRGIRPGDRGP